MSEQVSTRLEYKRNTGDYSNFTCTMGAVLDVKEGETHKDALRRVYDEVAEVFEEKMAEDANALTHG